MAYKRIDPNLLEVEDNNAQENTYGDFAKRLAGSAVKAPFQLAELPLRAIDYAFPNLKGTPEQRAEHEAKYGKAFPSEKIEEWIGGTKEPTTLAGKAIDYTVGNWPVLFAGGVPTTAAIGKDLFSSGAIAGAQEFGLGPVGQIATSVLAGAGFDKALNKVKGVKNAGKIELFKQGLYDQEKKLGAKIPVKSQGLVKEIDDIINTTNKKLVSDYGFTQSTKSGVLSNLEAIKTRLNKPDLKASDLFEANKALNEIYSPKKSVSGGIYKHAQSLIQEELENVYNGSAKRNKTYADVAKGANELHQIEHWNSGLSNWARSLDEVGTLPKIVSGIGATALGLLIKGTPGGTIAAGLSFGAEGSKYAAKGAHEVARAGKYLNSLRKTKEGTKLLFDIAAHAAKGATSQITKDMVKFNKLANKFEDTDDEITQVNPNDLEFA